MRTEAIRFSSHVHLLELLVEELLLPSVEHRGVNAVLVTQM